MQAHNKSQVKKVTDLVVSATCHQVEMSRERQITEVEEKHHKPTKAKAGMLREEMQSPFICCFIKGT